MLTSMYRIIILFSIILLGVSCGGGGSTSPVTPDYYVDAINGDDSNDGSLNMPYKTITTAMTVAVDGDLVQIQPGTYDAANGEIFPIVIPAGVTVRGDEANKGVGSIATRVDGNALVPGSTDYYTTLLPGTGATVSGLQVSTSSFGIHRHAVFLDGVDVDVRNNTFSDSYSGLFILNDNSSQVSGNVFNTSAYGIYGGSDGNPVFDNNNFVTPSLPASYGGNGVFRNNTVTGTGQVGFQLSSTGTTKKLIENNTFTHTSYTYGALRLSGTGSPVVRSNTFNIDSGFMIQVRTGCMPDLGSSGDNGNNTFNTSGSAASIQHEGTETFNAIGNNWPANPPVCGTDILITSTGSVVWGTGVTETCP